MQLQCRACAAASLYSTKMATATELERKFNSLRKRLDQMGYRQPLVIDSLPLVEKLFTDLNTESLKNAKLQGKNKEQKV